MKNFLLLTLVLWFWVAGVGYARPSSTSSGGGSRSSSSGSSRTFSSGSSGTSSSGTIHSKSSNVSGSKTWGSSTTFGKDSSKAWGSSSAPATPRADQPARSVAEQTLNQKTVGTTSASSRATAASNYTQTVAAEEREKNYARNYNANVDREQARRYAHYYDNEPAYWPSTVPHYYSYGGSRVYVVWSPFYHSYGWYGPSHSWIYYDSMAQPQTVIYNNYGGGGPAGGAGYASDYGSGRSRWSFWRLVLWLIVALTMVVLVWYLVALIIRSLKGDSREDRYVTETSPRPYYTPKERTSFKSPQATASSLSPAAPMMIEPRSGGMLWLSDTIALQDSLKVSATARAISVKITHVLRIREQNDLCAWIFVYGISEVEQQELLVKIKKLGTGAGAETQYVCYTKDLAGTRAELLRDGHYFLFQEPDNEAFNPADLKFARSFTRTLMQEETFSLIHPTELHGATSTESSAQELLGTVVEWRNVARSTNEYLCVETGAAGGESRVETWWGDALNASEVKITAQV